MEERLKQLTEDAKEKYKENKRFFSILKKRRIKRLDPMVHEIHEKVFAKTDCLTCGNCCKTTSPIFTEKDIKRIAKHFKMKEHAFIDFYLHRDKDDFWVLNDAPCAFLDLNDNMCNIYDVRPKACGEYPHTDRRKFIQITDLTLNNTSICPAVYDIVEELKEKFS